MAARALTAVQPQQKAQRELEDLQLVIRARNGDSVALDALIRRYTGLRPPEGELVLPRRRRRRGPRPGGADRPLQGGARLPLRQGDVVPQLRRALRHAADHHRDQDRDPLQARAAEHLRLVQPHAGRPGVRRRLHARRRAPRPGRRRPVGLRDLDRGAAEPRLLRSAPGSRRSRPTRCASTSTACRTRRWPSSSAATRRRSTTRSSA